MSIWLKNEVEKLAAQVKVLEEENELNGAVIAGMLARIEQLESAAETPKAERKTRGGASRGGDYL